MRQWRSEAEAISYFRQARRDWQAAYDFTKLGALRQMAERLWDCSRSLQVEQRVALAELMRDIADAIEHRDD